MRLFVAGEIAQTVALAAHDLVEALRLRTAILAPAARVAWVPADRFHLTIRFIGPVVAQVAAAIQEVLRPSLTTPVFSVTVAGTGAFPERGAPAVLWAGVENAGGGLADLEAEVSSRLARVGIPRELRHFRAHLTLARVKSPAGLRTASLYEGFERCQLGTTGIEAITLFESRLSPRGPQYVAVQRTGLRRPDAENSGG